MISAVMNEYEKLKESLSADKALDAATAEALLEKYPFLSIAASRALLNPDLTPEQKARFQAAVALNAPDTDLSLIHISEPTRPY